MKTLLQIKRILDDIYPESLSESWDRPGLIVGDLNTKVEKILITTDINEQVVDLAIKNNANLIISHHPLFFKPVHTVGGHTFRGHLVNKLIQNNCGLYCVHTSSDSVAHGVADAFADAIKLQNTKPIVPDANYPELGLGRFGKLSKPVTLEELGKTVFDVVMKTQHGIKIAGDLNDLIQTVAVLPGSGDSLFDEVRKLDADVYITSDIRHHPASDLIEQAKFEKKLYSRKNTKPAIIDVPHFAAENLGVTYCKDLLKNALGNNDDTEIVISDLQTDPWKKIFV